MKRTQAGTETKSSKIARVVTLYGLLGASLLGAALCLLHSEMMSRVKSLDETSAPRIPIRPAPIEKLTTSPARLIHPNIEKQDVPQAAPAVAVKVVDSPNVESLCLPPAVQQENAFYQMAATNPAAAVKLVKESGHALPTGILDNLVHQWAARDLTEAFLWVEQSADSIERERLLGRLAFVLSETDPSAAATFVAQKMSAGPFQDQAALSVVHQWAIRDPEAATDWVAAFPAGSLREQAEKELAGINPSR